MQEAAVRERQVRAAERILADFGDPEGDLADLQIVAAQVDDVGTDEQRVLDLAFGGRLAFAFCLRAHAALCVFVDFGARDRRVARVRCELLGDALGRVGAVRDVKRNFEIAVKNLHLRPVTVLVLDRVPVSGQQDIKVEATFKAPAPAKKDYNDRRGTNLWELAVDPDQEKKVAFGYRVTSPKDRPVVYFEQSPEAIQAGTRLNY